jgi:PKD repeat protein
MTYPADPGTGTPTNTIWLQVEDSLGLTHNASTTVTIYVNSPTAAMTASPNPAACNQSINFGGSGSSHGHAEHSIVTWEWDFDYDGATFDVDATGVSTSHAYGTFGSYTAALRVTDDNTTPKTDIDTAVIVVDQGNAPPTAGRTARTSSTKARIWCLTAQVRRIRTRAVAIPSLPTVGIWTATACSTTPWARVRRSPGRR